MERTVDDASQIADRLRDVLGGLGLINPRWQWHLMRGGRTNMVWLIEPEAGAEPLICRLSLSGRGTPVFPNLPDSEHMVIRALDGTGLAPEHLWAGETSEGPCLLYRACRGETWQADCEVVGKMLSRLHRQSMLDGLRQLVVTPKVLVAEGAAMLKQAAPAQRARMLECRPDTPEIPLGGKAFLHGDPVPGNIIVSEGRAVLIDWQCPAIGDPIYDLAIFLSPAMQVLGRGAPLSSAERSAVWAAYGDASVTARYNACEAAFCWRMAAYCIWRMTHGHEDYRPALEAELKRLSELR